MALREDFERQGAWLFKWRSYLPAVYLPMLFFALKETRAFESVYGDFFSASWDICSIVVSFIGFALRCATVGYVPRGTSGRNTQSQVAEALNTTGMYSVVRNPLYLSNFIIIFGITLFIQSLWFALSTCVIFWLYYERIMFTEEEFLRKKFGEEYLRWAEKTPLIIPRFSNWKKPALPFSFKTVLRREFSTFFSIVASYFFLELAGNILTGKKPLVDGPWLAFFLTGFLLYWTFYILKKKTKVLNVSGR